MSIALHIDLGYEFEVKAPAKEVFAVLANVPESASHYPRVQILVDLGSGVYRWEMEKIGVGAITLQTVYTSKYTVNKTKKTVVWTPAKGEGNARVSGSWTLSAKKKSTQLVLQVEAELTLPLPSITKLVVEPLIEAEFARLTEQYIANLCDRFGGEV